MLLVPSAAVRLCVNGSVKKTLPNVDSVIDAGLSLPLSSNQQLRAIKKNQERIRQKGEEDGLPGDGVRVTTVQTVKKPHMTITTGTIVPTKILQRLGGGGVGAAAAFSGVI